MSEKKCCSDCGLDDECEGFFERMFPSAVHLVCGLPIVTQQRQKIVPLATGDVVEIGFGTGHNLPHYDRDGVRSLVGINPDDGLPRRARKAIASQDMSVELLVESAEDMSLSNGCADSVVVTYSLCSIGDVMASLAEVNRVLRPHGRLFFCEHGRSPSAFVAGLQDRLNTPWRWMAGGCNLNRDVGQLLQQSGFVLERYDVFDLGFGTRVLGTHHMGIARKK